MIDRTYCYRLYPNRAQANALHGHVNEACRLYNAALQERRDAWRMRRESISFYSQDAQLKLIRSDGNIGIKNFDAARNVLRRVDLAFQGFFRRFKAGQKAGYPRFRSARRYDSITFSRSDSGWSIRHSGRLYLQGIGDVKVKWHRTLEGVVKAVTIKREGDKWYAHFRVKVIGFPLEPSTEAVGVDVGLAAFATLSTGEEIANPRFDRSAAAKVRRSRRRVSRRKRGSNGRRKAVRLLQKTLTYVRNQRADFHHKVSRDLVDRFGLIAVEDLNVKGLAGSVLARSVNDAGWGYFLEKLTYKAEGAGRVLIKVNPNGTTQRCSGCQTVVPKTLSQRWHRCPSCNLSLSRDENAAREILRLGLSLEAPTWPVAACVASEAQQLRLWE
jgi:putative transposase